MTPDDIQTRAGLAKAITRVESRRLDHQNEAKTLLEKVMPYTGRSLRIGITGVPGVGKSTFIETFGKYLTSKGLKIAVLAVDPTSRRSGGSILGDKTRMAELSVDPNAFVRPSPAGETLGGVSRKTRESLLLCEAAGFDIILVETVGVGQSETVVADMVDVFLVLMLPNAGDELQGIKKGVLEVADIIAVNKADLNPDAAKRAASHYRNALHILPPSDSSWSPPVLTLSALNSDGISGLFETIMKYKTVTTESGSFKKRRSQQQLRWLDSLIDDGLQEIFHANRVIQTRMSQLRLQVAEGKIAASSAADELLKMFRSITSLND